MGTFSPPAKSRNWILEKVDASVETPGGNIPSLQLSQPNLKGLTEAVAPVSHSIRKVLTTDTNDSSREEEEDGCLLIFPLFLSVWHRPEGEGGSQTQTAAGFASVCLI